MINYSIDYADINDVDGIYDVEVSCFEDSWSKESFYNDIKNSVVSKYFVAKDMNKNIIGFGGIYNIVGEAHITNIAVLNEYRCCGVASSLLNKIIDWSINNDCIGITLEVRVSNTSAINLYRKFGFSIEGKRKEYYRNNKEDAYIMWLYLDEYNFIDFYKE